VNHHRRRQFLLAAAALASSRLAFGQAERVRRVGILTLSVGSSEQAQWGQLVFKGWMRAAGYEEGRNLTIEWRYADGDVAKLPALAQDLVRLNVDLIMASFNDAIAAAKAATRTIPIVMFNSINPVEQGFVDSLARPGGNITGTAWSAPEVSGKILQVLGEAVPRMKRVALLGNTSMRGIHDYGVSTMKGATALGLDAKVYPIARPQDIPAALQEITAAKPQAIYIALDTVLLSALKEIVAFTIKQKLPSIANVSLFTDAGGMLCYGPDLKELGEHTVAYVARILGGTKPSDLPVELPSNFELVVNQKTAKLIGHKVPQAVLLRASRVIE
jgi:putative ABC transport system substrate-binding protein